jgi:hypothetical protein
LRPLERALANACRLWLIAEGSDDFQEIGRELVLISLSLLLFERTRLEGAGWSVDGPDAVILESLREDPGGSDVIGSGVLRLSRQRQGGVTQREEGFTFSCTLPWQVLRTTRTGATLRLVISAGGTA